MRLYNNRRINGFSKGKYMLTEKYDVDKGNFSITTYYPPEPPLKHLLNPFRKNDIPQVPEFTIGMLIASARSGRWLYD
ncbi:DUF1493 family protein [Salmonella enterica]|nr:DUF1493 family protein [Salmonella enterica]